MGSASGVEQVAARRVGMSLEQYRAKREAGLKWCYAHADWHDVTNFDMDRSRGDGRTAQCREARYQRSTSGRPGMAERRQWAKRGFAWCRGCRCWLTADLVRSGVCRYHANEENRAFYAGKSGAAIRAQKQARARGLEPIPVWWREERFADLNGLCAYGCGRKATTLDHVFPVRYGGQSTPTNLVPACRTCNSSKGARDPEPWIAKGLAAFPDHWEAVLTLGAAA